MPASVKGPTFLKNGLPSKSTICTAWPASEKSRTAETKSTVQEWDTMVPSGSWLARPSRSTYIKSAVYASGDTASSMTHAL